MPLANPYFKKLGLSHNPFPGPALATYSEDVALVYVPQMFSEQRDEFLRKFVLTPLENGQPLIGAVWSVAPGDPAARGFGKSTLMGEEAKQINRDFGFSTLRELGVEEEDAKANPILAGYVSFNAKATGGIDNIDAAAFHLVRFVLKSDHESGASIHQCLRERAAAAVAQDVDDGTASDMIVDAIKTRFRRLAVNIDIRNLLKDFLFHLAGTDTDELLLFLADEVSTWHHNRNGLKYLQLLVAFAEIAGIQHFTFFIDQVEDFTSRAGYAKIEKNVKIIRDALIEAEPFRSRASFVFQLHPDAYTRLENAWLHEDLPSLDHTDPLAEPVVVVLKGLESFESARLLAERFLNHPKAVLTGRKKGITPFTEEALKAVWQATQPRPRWYLRALHSLLELGRSKEAPVIDEAFVKPNLEHLAAEARRDTDEGDEGDDRLTASGQFSTMSPSK